MEDKIPDLSSYVKKTNYDTAITAIEKKITDHNHDKYATTPEFNTLAASVFNSRLAQANLITKTDFNTKVSSLHSKIAANESKFESIENKLKGSFFKDQRVVLWPSGLYNISASTQTF